MQNRLIPLLILAVLGAVATLWFLGGDDAPPAPPVGNGEPLAESTKLASAPPAPAEADAAVRESVTTDVALLAATDDPGVAAALGGFRGRVLNHDKSIVAGSRVELYRLDPEVAVGQMTDVFASEEELEPEIEVGHATTDDEGRFTMTGVWPRSLYMMQAGLDTPNPTVTIVERTPGPGEIVDLGDIILRNGAVLTGRVTDEDGNPLAGAWVRVVDIPVQILQLFPLERFDPNGAVVVGTGRDATAVRMPGWLERRIEDFPIPSTISGPDGRFRVTGIEAGIVHAVVTAPEFVAALESGISVEPGEIRDIGVLDLREGEEAFGKVVDRRGEPVPGAEVLIAQGGSIGDVRFAGPPLTTNADGEFSLLGFKPGNVIGAARRAQRDTWVVGSPQPVTRDLVLELPSRLALTVDIRGADGSVIATPELQLLPGSPDEGSLGRAHFGFSRPLDLDSRVKRLEDGRRVIEDLNEGTYTLLVRAPGFAVTTTAIKLFEDVEQTVELARDTNLQVRVAERSGKAVRGATVYAFPIRPREAETTPADPTQERRRRRRRGRDEMPIPIGVTDAQGQLLAAGIPPGTVRISARHPAYGWTHERAEAPGDPVLLYFDSPGTIHGILTEEGGLPTPGKWTVILSKRGDRSERAMPEMPRLMTPDLRGEFEIVGLQPGEYRLRVVETLNRFKSIGSFMQTMMMSAFADRGTVDVEVLAGATTPVNLDTQVPEKTVDGPSAQVSGTVLVDGRPAEGMMVASRGGSRARADVDAAGRFDLGRVRAGELRLYVVDPTGGGSIFTAPRLFEDRIQVEADQDVVLDISFSTGSLAGTVIDADGAPLGGVPVRVRGTLENGASSSLFGVSDSRGRFEFPRLAAGTYSVRASDENRGTGVQDGIDVDVGLREATVQLTKPVAAEGAVRIAGWNSEPSRMWLSLTMDGGSGFSRGGTVSVDGSFSVSNLVPGDYRVTLYLNFDGDGTTVEYSGLLSVGAEGARGLDLLFTKPQ